PRQGGATGRAQSAYVWAPGGTGPVRLLARLLGEGFNVAVAGEPLVVDGLDFPRGSFIARVGRNDESLHARIDALARDAGVAAYAAASAFPVRGPTGTGSETTRSLAAPDIAVLAGEGVGISSFGWLWFELERRVHYPFTAVRASDLGEADLDRFEVVVLPSGSFDDELGERSIQRLKDWVERGGTLIAYDAAARWVQDADFGAAYVAPDTAAPSADSVRALVERIAAAALSEEAESRDAALPPAISPGARPAEPEAVPGAFLRVRLDPTHWLTVGYEAGELPVLMQSLPLRASTDGANPVVFTEDDDLVISGFAWPLNTRRTYGGGAYATVDDVGDGRIVLFADDPLYRGVYEAPATLLWNAIFLGAPGRAGAER
ncbi:MAG: hypothetical protein ACRELV_13055, partial [Longimicrobiales bacterium]